MLTPTDKKYFSYQISQRFLAAMDSIIGNRTNGKVTAQTFGEIVGMSSSNLSRLRKDTTGENCVTVEAIGRVCGHYKISAHWLVTGEGEIYTNTELSLESRVLKLEEAVNRLEKKKK